MRKMSTTKIAQEKVFIQAMFMLTCPAFAHNMTFTTTFKLVITYNISNKVLHMLSIAFLNYTFLLKKF